MPETGSPFPGIPIGYTPIRMPLANPAINHRKRHVSAGEELNASHKECLHAG